MVITRYRVRQNTLKRCGFIPERISAGDYNSSKATHKIKKIRTNKKRGGMRRTNYLLRANINTLDNEIG